MLYDLTDAVVNNIKIILTRSGTTYQGNELQTLGEILNALSNPIKEQKKEEHK